MLIITCEHATNAIPAPYRPWFTDFAAELNSHQGYDIGALELAKRLAKLADFSSFGTASRLLVELNRSLHHPQLFSAITKPLAKTVKQAMLANYYFPYREQVKQTIAQAIANNQRVVHISVHSFTPELNGHKRHCDIGLLYDSRRQAEREFCQHWKQLLTQPAKELLVRFNYPYAGKADGFTTYLRKQYTEAHYLGIELEVNQKYPLMADASWWRLQQHIISTFKLLANTLTRSREEVEP